MKQSRFLLQMLLIVIILMSCGDRGHFLTVLNSSWPDGTVVSVIENDSITSTSRLYGMQTRIDVPDTGVFTIRAASTGMITFRSDSLTAGESRGIHGGTFKLPEPAHVRTIGSRRCGIYPGDAGDSTYCALIERFANELSTCTIDRKNIANISHVVGYGHERSVEMLAGISLNELRTSELKETIASWEAVCLDGVVVDAGKHDAFGSGEAEFVAELAEEMHERGMTVSLELSTGCRNERLKKNDALIGLFSPEDTKKIPDGLRLSFVCDDTMSFVTPYSVEEALVSLERNRIAPDMVSVTIRMTAHAFRLNGKDALETKQIQRGELARLVTLYDSEASIRLSDGSLRLGDSGTFYVYGDCQTVAKLIGNLQNGPFSRSGGIHVSFDGYGIRADKADFAVISQVMAGK